MLPLWCPQHAHSGRLYRIREAENDYTTLLQPNIPCDIAEKWFDLFPPLSFLLIAGVVLPVWNPQNPSVGDKVARAIVYFVALIYMFLGMSIIADRFMSSIEVSQWIFFELLLDCTISYWY